MKLSELYVYVLNSEIDSAEHHPDVYDTGNLIVAMGIVDELRLFLANEVLKSKDGDISFDTCDFEVMRSDYDVRDLLDWLEDKRGQCPAIDMWMEEQK